MSILKRYLIHRDIKTEEKDSTDGVGARLDLSIADDEKKSIFVSDPIICTKLLQVLQMKKLGIAISPIKSTVRASKRIAAKEMDEQVLKKVSPKALTPIKLSKPENVVLPSPAARTPPPALHENPASSSQHLKRFMVINVAFNIVIFPFITIYVTMQKMLKCGVPAAAVTAKMTAEGISVEDIQLVMGEKFTVPVTATDMAPTEVEKKTMEAPVTAVITDVPSHLKKYKVIVSLYL